MGFWIYCAACTLLIPCVMLFFGRRFQTKPPKSINSLYGYRTSRSMKNQQTWDYAHRLCGRIWLRTGAVLLPVSLLAMLAVLGRASGAVGTWCAMVTAVQVVVILFTLPLVERGLKQKFDREGKER